MEYNFRDIEQKWQQNWIENKVYKVANVSPKPKYYVLDMFPYPSGAGLHVGHPLGYIASDIYARFKRLKGFNVLHPMGYDAFGLPAEQYAIEHGIHPAVSTENNINNFRKQLDKIGFCYDWDREVKTCDPKYYKWTQWIFLQLFNAYFNRKTQKAESITQLIKTFEKEGNINHEIPNTGFQLPVTGNWKPETGNTFTADEWKTFDAFTQQSILMEYRLAYCGYGEVNWCEALGTVLANDEVVNGVSERGGHPVVKKKLRQWYLRITEYADRLLQGLQTVDFSDAMKEMQTNWIGKSTGAEIEFKIVLGEEHEVTEEKKGPIIHTSVSIAVTYAEETLKVYTTRPDTIFGVDFMVVAPEHDLIDHITTAEQKQTVDEYIAYVKSRSDRERQAEKKITGAFTGAYAVNPFNGKQIPIWISEYVLAGYGTGAIMAVPCGDERDFKFAKHFNIPITNIIGKHFNGEEANATKEVPLENSDFLNGIIMKDAIEIVVNKLVEMGIGKKKVNYKMRDAAFSRQRYWGEPFPIVWKDGVAYPVPEDKLPLELPEVKTYSPGPEGEGPLANIPDWIYQFQDADFIPPSGGKGALETNTMPGYAGSSWYFLRYMDNENENEFAGKQATDYWNQVDVYIGGTEHAVGHLLYSRMWTKALYDLGYISFDEPFKKLVNQGMIQGSSRFVYRLGNISYQIKCDKEAAFEYYNKNILIENEWQIIEKELLFQFTSFLSRIIPNIFLSKRHATNLDATAKSGLFIDQLNIITKNELEKNPNNFILSSKVEFDIINSLTINPLRVDVNIVDGFELDKEAFKKWRNGEFKDAILLGEALFNEAYICGDEIEKMSKSKFNTVDPSDLVEKYGADTFRMYEMFLGPVEQSKPWDTKGIEGVHRFLKKLWRLFYKEGSSAPSPSERAGGEAVWNQEKATDVL